MKNYLVAINKNIQNLQKMAHKFIQNSIKDIINKKRLEKFLKFKKFKSWEN